MFLTLTPVICCDIVFIQDKTCEVKENGGRTMKMRLDKRKIYLAMAEKGLTATEIAKQGGVSQQAISNALNGNGMGRVKVVPAICKALDLSANDIVIIED